MGGDLLHVSDGHADGDDVRAALHAAGFGGVGKDQAEP